MIDIYMVGNRDRKSIMWGSPKGRKEGTLSLSPSRYLKDVVSWKKAAESAEAAESDSKRMANGEVTQFALQFCDTCDSLHFFAAHFWHYSTNQQCVDSWKNWECLTQTWLLHWKFCNTATRGRFGSTGVYIYIRLFIYTVPVYCVQQSMYGRKLERLHQKMCQFTSMRCAMKLCFCVYDTAHI